MTVFHWILLSAFVVCMLSCLYHFFKALPEKNETDHASPDAKTSSAVVYSFTKAMSPKKKETAFLHLPTYTAGIFYHLGTFLSVFLLVINFLSLEIPLLLKYIIIGFLVLTSISGLFILIKRMLNSVLKNLSNPDDFISNILVTVFQISTAGFLLLNIGIEYYFILATILFLYLPLGKLKHTVYFFAARYHLGVFYGRRGTWPLKK